MIKDEKLTAIEPVVLKDHVDYSNGSVVSKTLLENGGGTMTLFAFDAGQSLSRHSAPFDAAVQVLEGRLELEIGEKKTVLTGGQLIVMPADIPHALKALEKTRMLLTMVRP